MSDDLTYEQWTALHVLRSKNGVGPSPSAWQVIEGQGWVVGGELTPAGEAAYQACYERYRHQRTPRRPIGRR